MIHLNLYQIISDYNKLLFKISKCKINQLKKVKWINRFNTIKLFLEDKISKFSSYIKDKTLGYLLDHFQYYNHIY